ncbi:peptidoglycan bridge formation glycyltransferase FemA/FemB family protein [Bacillus sp. BRMEA1]|uniref:lipid II:glycine glycyltransferase FemX n=1 Tax=Neobacillus endophyticus TaxID=2738405 RepID=UPI001565C535|nr:GNAT family N-acetyltransferase [Neobacillus endophyticus]NRD76319.1 peptidoglycan bridge formation glycyltransferase FemA/FemB family protein [Neobacillus endophyticus]
MYEVISYKDKNKWEEKLNLLAKKDIFYRHAYSNVYQSMGDGDPHLFYYEDEQGNKLCYVFFKRKLNGLPFLAEGVDRDLYDIITPSYGYGGPIYDVEEKQLIKNFRKEFDEYCQKENIISEFIRFHPVLQNNKHMEESIDVSYDRETVFIDLTKSEEDILKQYQAKHRGKVNKAIKNQLEFRTFRNEQAYERVEDFYQLYKETMDKLNASEYSYFSTEYIKGLLSGFYDQSIIGAVFYEDQMIAATLCLYEDGVLHYHLACSQKQYLNLGCNTFLLHNAALWGKQNGCHTFHLGSGHVGRDSLFQFKYRFNPDGLLHFNIGKKIHNPFQYKFLLEQWEKYYEQEAQENFFPAYRRIPKKADLSII